MEAEHESNVSALRIEKIAIDRGLRLELDKLKLQLDGEAQRRKGEFEREHVELMREVQRRAHADEDECAEVRETVKQVKRIVEESTRLKREIREAERDSVVCGDEIHDLGLELTRKRGDLEENQAIERGVLDPRPP